MSNLKYLANKIMSNNHDYIDTDSYYISYNRENEKYDECIMTITELQLLIEKKEKELFGITGETKGNKEQG